MGKFVHGQTYGGMPSTVAGALEVHRFLEYNKLVENVSKEGRHIRVEKRLRAVFK